MSSVEAIITAFLEFEGRFWIMTVMWDSSPGKSIPDRYIGSAGGRR